MTFDFRVPSTKVGDDKTVLVEASVRDVPVLRFTVNTDTWQRITVDSAANLQVSVVSTSTEPPPKADDKAANAADATTPAPPGDGTAPPPTGSTLPETEHGPSPVQVCVI